MRENHSVNGGTTVVVSFVAGMAVLLGFTLWQADKDAARRRLLEDNPAVVIKIGSRLPQFKLVTQDRASFSLKDMCKSRQAKAMLIHFFSLENRSYDREFSRVSELDRRYGSKGLYTIYVNTDMSPRKEMMAFAKAKALSSPLLLDMYSKTLFSYGFEQPPATVIADRNCRAVQVFTHKMPIGQRAEDALRWTLDLGPSPFAVRRNSQPAQTPPRQQERPDRKPEPAAKDQQSKRHFPEIKLSAPSILKKNAKAAVKAPAKDTPRGGKPASKPK